MPQAPPQAPTPPQPAPPGPSRWSSLQCVAASPQLTSGAASIVPIAAAFALTGGSGKTSIIASLAYLLSLAGERVLLADTNPEAPVAACFSVDHLPPGAVRSVIRSPASAPAITLTACDLEAASTIAHPHRLVEHLLHLGSGSSRILLDLSERAGWLIRLLAGPSLTVIILVSPSMSAIISLQAMQRFFRDLADPQGRLVQPVYLINQFDESLAAHRDVRDFLSRQLGDRLLPFIIRSAAGVGQARDHGMCVAQYAPKAPITADLKALADWLRTASPPALPPPPAPLPNSRWRRA